jgi:Tfp pilus assembly protein PilF
MFTDDMDIYGYLLKQKGQLGELGKLIHDMLRTNPKKSECWTCVAMYYDMKGRRDAAYEHGARARRCWLVAFVSCRPTC